MADDLEAFLRQAAQRRVQRQREGGQRPPPPVQRPEPDIVIEPDLVIEDSPVEPTQRLSTSDISDHAEQLGSERLGERVGMADEKLEARLHQQFDHSVGRLQSQTPSQPTAKADETPPIEAEDLIKLLRKPETLRQAILLREILTRPTERW